MNYQDIRERLDTIYDELRDELGMYEYAELTNCVAALIGIVDEAEKECKRRQVSRFEQVVLDYVGECGVATLNDIIDAVAPKHNTSADVAVRYMVGSLVKNGLLYRSRMAWKDGMLVYEVVR